MSDPMFVLLVIAILLVCGWAIGIFDFILIVLASIIEAFFGD